MTDLSLIPIESLIEEIDKRTDHYVLGFVQYDKGLPIVSCFHSTKRWMDEVGLAEVLKNDVLNNYEGEQEPESPENAF